MKINAFRRFVAAVFSSVALSAAFAESDPFRPEKAPAGECRAALDVRQGNRMPIVAGEINGVGCTLLLDTGATHTTFNMSFVRESLPDVQLVPVMMMGETNVEGAPRFMQVRSLKIGEVAFETFGVMALDISHLEKAVGVKVDGIIGMNVLGRVPCIISLGAGEIVFSPGAQSLAGFGRAVQRLEYDSMSIWLPATVDGRRFEVLVDSGASMTLLSSDTHWPTTGVASIAPFTDINGAADLSPRSGAPGVLDVADGIEISPVVVAEPMNRIGADTLLRYDMFVDGMSVRFRRFKAQTPTDGKDGGPDPVSRYDGNMCADGVVVTNGLKWIDGRSLPIEGRAFSDVDHWYDRLPSGVTTNVNEGVRNMKHHTAGMQFRFSTDSNKLVFKWVPYNGGWMSMDHMPKSGMSGIDVYCYDTAKGRWRYVKTGRIEKPSGAQLEIPWSPGAPCLVNLPLYNGIKEFSLGVETNAVVKPLGPRKSGVEKPVVFYGTSITQGGCASRPGMSFVNIIGRELDVPVVNLGFSGSGVMELEMSEHLARIDASCYVLDCLHNMRLSTNQTARKGRNMDENYEPFIRNLRAKRPDVPIVMAGQCDVYCNGPTEKDVLLKSIYDKLVAEGWKDLVYLPKDAMYSDDLEGSVDGVHPNDYGMVALARAYGEAVSKALGLSAAHPCLPLRGK